MDPFNKHLKEIPTYSTVTIQHLNTQLPMDNSDANHQHQMNLIHHATEHPQLSESQTEPQEEELKNAYAKKVQDFVKQFPNSESLRFNVIIPEAEILFSKAAKKAAEIYENLSHLSKSYNYSSIAFDTSKKVFLEQITLESLTNNIVSNSIITHTQKTYEFPDTIYVRIFVTSILLLILASTSFKLLLLVLLISIPICVNTVKLVVIAMVIKILCYLLFSTKKKETYIEESINLFQQQSSSSFVYVPIVLSIILLTLMKFDLLEGPIVWGGLTLVIASIFFWQQAMVREKSPTNLWMIVAPLLLLVISMLLISFRGNGLAYIWSYTDNINLKNRAEIVSRKGEINYMKQSVVLNSEYSDLVDDYGEMLLTVERGYHYVPKQQRQETSRKPKEPDKPTQLGILWFNEENWTSTFFSALVPFALFVLHFYIHSQKDVGQDVVVASVIAAQKDSSNKDSQTPHYEGKITSYIITTRLVPPLYLILIVLNLAISLYFVVDWKHAVFLIAIYGLAIPTTSLLFSTLSTMAWTSVATNIRGGPPQISRDYFFGNVVTGLATNHIRQVVCGTSITFALVVTASLLTNNYGPATILSLIMPLVFCVVKYYTIPTDANYQTFLMISIALALQCYIAVIILTVAQIYMQHSIIFYTFNIKGKRNATLGQPESLAL